MVVVGMGWGVVMKCCTPAPPCFVDTSWLCLWLGPALLLFFVKNACKIRLVVGCGVFLLQTLARTAAQGGCSSAGQGHVEHALMHAALTIITQLGAHLGCG